MAIDMNADVGEIFKKLFSKKQPSQKNDKVGKKPSDPFLKIVVTGVVALILAGLYLFFVYFPTQDENRIKEQKIAQINDLNTCLTELSEKITSKTRDLSLAKDKYKKLTNLFHSGQELDDLYRHISTLALSNQLMVSKIEKVSENPIFELEKQINDDFATVNSMTDVQPIDDLNSNTVTTLSACDLVQNYEQIPEEVIVNDAQFPESLAMEGSSEQENVKKKVAYYELKVEFEITGDYVNYTNFRKGLSKLKKIININQEKIMVVESETKRGEVKVGTILAIYRLPANEEEKYANVEQNEDML